jgi:soluble lytic murein transglycosylase-like protein
VVRDPWKAFRPRRRIWLRVAVTQLVLLALGAVVIGAMAAWASRLRADADTGAALSGEVEAELAVQQRRLEAARGELEVTRLQLERATEIIKYSAQYRISADLSAVIYDIALAEGIHPSLGYQLVKVESNFQPRARSAKGAIGYTQIRLATARAYNPDLTEGQLAQREVNLRLGFRFLKDLLERFDDDLSLALVAYNRGPTVVDSIRAAGGDPANGYAESVTRGLPRKVARPGTSRGS